MLHSRRRFFSVNGHSPILRIVLVVSVMLLSQGCDKLGIGQEPDRADRAAGGRVDNRSTRAVGASDANGVGSSVPCVPFDRVPGRDGLRARHRATAESPGFHGQRSSIWAFPTAVISRDFQTLGQQYNRIIAGNFIDQEMPFVQHDATLVTIFAGVNEVNVITAALGGGAGGSDPNGYIDAAGPRVRRRLHDAACRHQDARRLAAHRRAERAERRRAAVPGRRIAGAAAGRAARRGRA